MAKSFDFKGLKCPMPTLKLSKETMGMDKGEVVEILADCPTFEEDVKKWCDRMKKTLVWIRAEGSAKRCQIRL